MPVGNVDYDRGVIISQHPSSGMDVYMYADDPGVYFDAHSNALPEQIAREAGYDVEKLAKDKLKKDRKNAALKMIDDELADDKDVKEEVVQEKNGFKLVGTGLGRFHVSDPEGNRLTPRSMSKEIATKLLDSMAGEPAAKISLKK